jgi:hypothetical protein
MEERLLSIFLDSSGRPKITPRHESSIIVFAEKEYSPGKVKTGLQRLESSGALSSVKKTVDGVGDVKFYFPSKFNNGQELQKIRKKIDRSAVWIAKYSHPSITKMLGKHLHDVVRSEIRVHGFEILEEGNVKKHGSKEWTKTNHSLDIVARHRRKNLTIGVEVKNMLSLDPLSEVLVKLEMCRHLEITPVFACRWMESHKQVIKSKDGFLWQFGVQLYPRGQEKFVDAIRKRFKFPVMVSSELPQNSINEFERWLHSS